MKMMVRQMIDMARSSGQLLTKNWDQMELPKLPREMVKAASPAALLTMSKSQANFIQKITRNNPVVQAVPVC